MTEPMDAWAEEPVPAAPVDVEVSTEDPRDGSAEQDDSG